MTDGLDSIPPSRSGETILHVNAVDPDSGGSGDGHVDPQTADEKERGRKHAERKAPADVHGGKGPAPSLNTSTLLNDEVSLTHSARAIQEGRNGPPPPVKEPPEEDAAPETGQPEDERVHIHVFA